VHREGALHKDTSFLPHHPVGGEEAGAEGIVLEAGMCDLKKHFFKLIYNLPNENRDNLWRRVGFTLTYC